MPFVIEKRADEWCVLTQGEDGEGEGSPHGCHPTRRDAVNQMRALYANVPDARKEKDKAPYGDVEYADPGYQSDKQKRYPIDTEDHVRAAWSYINKESNAAKYSSEDLAKVKGRIRAAAKKFGIEISEGKEYGMDIFFGSEVKTYGEGKFKGLLVPYGSLDAHDGDGDFFTKETDFDFEDGDRRSGYFRHGFHVKVGNKRIGRGSLSLSDPGVMLDGGFNLQDPDVEEIWEAAKDGLLGLSSGALNHLVRRHEVKEGVYHVTHWPIGEWSVTRKPCDSRARILTIKEFLGDEGEDGRGRSGGDRSSLGGLVSGLSLDVKGDLALVFARAFLEHAASRSEARVKEGRVLSSSNLTKIQKVGDGMDEMRKRISELGHGGGDTQQNMLVQLGQMQNLIAELLTDGRSEQTSTLSPEEQLRREVARLQAQRASSYGVNT